MEEKKKSQLKKLLAVQGSRSLNDERVKILILEEIERIQADEIITSAEPDGVCGVARQLAKERAIPLKLHFLNFKFLRGAFEHRSKAILMECDAALFIHDGESKGTANELILAKKMGVPYHYEKIERSEYINSVGFDITTDWNINPIDNWL